jgi:hypothetical protein
VISNKKGVIGKKNADRTLENTHCVIQVLTQSPNKSVKHLSQQLRLGASLIYRIICNVKLLLYKIQMQQTLCGTDKGRRVGLCEDVFGGQSTVTQSIWFSDQAHYHFNGYVNMQKKYTWAGNHWHQW